MPRKKRNETTTVPIPGEEPVNAKVIFPQAELEPEVDVKPVVAESAKEAKPSDMVKVKVLVGSLRYEAGTFQKGDVFETSRKQAKQFDPKDVQLL